MDKNNNEQKTILKLNIKKTIGRVLVFGGKCYLNQAKGHVDVNVGSGLILSKQANIFAAGFLYLSVRSKGADLSGKWNCDITQ